MYYTLASLAYRLLVLYAKRIHVMIIIFTTLAGKSVFLPFMNICLYTEFIALSIFLYAYFVYFSNSSFCCYGLNRQERILNILIIILTYDYLKRTEHQANNGDSQHSQIELFIVMELYIITLSEMVYNVQVYIIMNTIMYMLYEEMQQTKTLFLYVNIDSNNLNIEYAG